MSGVRSVTRETVDGYTWSMTVFDCGRFISHLYPPKKTKIQYTVDGFQNGVYVAKCFWTDTYTTIYDKRHSTLVEARGVLQGLYESHNGIIRDS